jgi:hypothetical protein
MLARGELNLNDPTGHWSRPLGNRVVLYPSHAFCNSAPLPASITPSTGIGRISGLYQCFVSALTRTSAPDESPNESPVCIDLPLFAAAQFASRPDFAF